MTTPQTPSHIVSTVVYTFSGIAALYFTTLAACILTGRVIPETLSAHFANVGSTVLGVLAGLLMNTKSNPVPTASTSETVTTTREVLETPPVEPNQPPRP